jgi:hypothetical protein
LIPAFYEAFIWDNNLVAANRCRLYLRVMTLSDICDGWGDDITAAAWLSHRDTDRPHYYEWSAQGHPSSNYWGIWRKAIDKHLMFQITRALYRWYWVHGQTRRILGNGSTPTQTIDFSTAQNQTSGNLD